MPMQYNNGTGFMGGLTLIFIALKLSGHITWSWWWVLAPVWAIPALLLSSVLVLLAGSFIYDVCKRG